MLQQFLPAIPSTQTVTFVDIIACSRYELRFTRVLREGKGGDQARPLFSGSAAMRTQARAVTARLDHQIDGAAVGAMIRWRHARRSAPVIILP